MNFIIQKLKSKHTSLKKIYKLSKTNIVFSHFEGTRGEKKQIFCTQDKEIQELIDKDLKQTEELEFFKVQIEELQKMTAPATCSGKAI